jgi:hypothetical protein
MALTTQLKTRPDLFSLPREIAYLIFEWLSLKDLRELDNSITNHYLRPIFISLLNGMNILSYSSAEDPEYYDPITRLEEPLDWILLRNLIPLDINLYSFPSLIPMLIERSRSHVRSLQFWYRSFYPRSSFRLLGHCPSLRRLLICGCDDLSQEELEHFLRLNPQLESFALMPEGDGFTPDFISFLAQTSVGLKHLSFEGCSSFNDECVPLLVSGQLDLRELNLSCTRVRNHQSFCLILKAFPNLHCLSLTQVDISLETINMCLTEVIVPSIMSADPQRQRLGLKSLYDLWINQSVDRFPLLVDLIASLKIIPEIIKLLQSPHQVRCI